MADDRLKRTLIILLSSCLGVFVVSGSVSAGVPGEPVSFRATPGDGAVTLRWDPEPQSTVYVLRRRVLDLSPTPTGTLAPSATPIATVRADATLAVVDPAVSNGRSYLYEVAGINGDGEGSPATLVTAPFRIPAAVSPVTVSRLHSGALDLGWAPPSSSYPVGLYRIFRFVPSPADTATFTATPTGDSPTPTLTPTGTWNTPTPSPSPTLPPTPIAAGILLTAQPTPYATVSGNSFIDAFASQPGNPPLYYLVQAVDASGNEGLLPEYSTTPLQPAPLAPFAPLLSAAVTQATPTWGVRLFWTGLVSPEDVLSYQVKRQGVTIAVLTPTPGATQSWDDTTTASYASSSLFPAYQIVASNLLGSSASNTVKAGILHPLAVGTLQVTPGATAQAVTLSWDPGTAGTYGLAGYRIFRSSALPPPVGTQTHTPVATVEATPATTLAWVDTAVSNAHSLHYWIEPYDALSRAGSRAPVTPTPLILAPTPVTGLTVSGPSGNNRVEVSWSPGGAGFYGQAVFYRLYRRITQTPTPQAISTVAADVTSFQDAVVGVGPQTPVVYQVSALDVWGNESTLSNLSDPVTMGDPQVPAAPSVNAVSGSASSLSFGWPENPSPDQVLSYEVHGSGYWIATPEATPLAVVTAVPTFMTWTANGLNPWEEAVYWLYAVNAQGRGDPATLRAIVPGSIQVTAEITPDTRKVDVSWTLQPTASVTPVVDAVVVHRSESPDSGFIPVGTVPAGTDSFVDATAAGGKRYYYRVTARDSASGAESPLLPGATPDPVADVSVWPSAPVFTVTPMVAATGFAWQPTATQEAVSIYHLYRNATYVAGSPADGGYAIYLSLADVPGALVRYQMIAENSVGMGDPSVSVTLLVPPAVTPQATLTPPAAWTPTPSVPILSGSTWITELTYPGDVAQYSIYRSTDSSFATETQVGIVAAPTSIFADLPSSLPPDGTVHYYRVVARTSNGVEAVRNLSGPLTVTLWPAAPVSLAVSSSQSAMTVCWAAPVSGAVTPGSYTVYRSEGVTATRTPVATLTAPSTVWVDPAVTPGGAYIYGVEAYGAGGPSPSSVAVSGLAMDPPVLQVTPLPGRHSLSWTQLAAAGSVTGYVVERRAIPTPQFTPLSGLLRGMAVTTFTDLALIQGTTYVYRVAGADAFGTAGGWSEPVTQAAAPLPVSGLRALSGDGIVQLLWDFQAGTTVTYTIQRKLGSAPGSDYSDLRTGYSAVNFADATAVNKTYWTYRVITVDSSSGLTAVSSEVTALPARAPVLGDRTVRADPNEFGVVLTWSPADPPGTFEASFMYPLAGYRIYRSVDGGATYEWIATVPAGTTTYTDPVDVLGGPTRTYLVRAYDDTEGDPGLAHESAYELVRVAPLQARTALDRNSLRPFGGPDEKTVNIRFVVTQEGRVTLKVYSLSGVYVKQLVDARYGQGIHWTSWDGKNDRGEWVASGVYLITTFMENRREVQKIAVVK